jgi:23S rRNA (uracil1939-C5)-methyltransferase
VPAVTDDTPTPLLITRLGAQGDGIAETDAGRIFVPFALPRETWRQRADETFERVGPPSPTRRDPPCPHFGVCGGCIAQHMDAETYIAWKRQIAVDAFAHQGIEIEPPPIWQAPEASRRRVTLTAHRGGDGILRLGYRRAASHDFCAIESCLIADPLITARLEALAGLADIANKAMAKPADLRVAVTAAANGLSVAIDADGRRLGPGQRTALAQRAEAAGVIRLTIGSDEIFQRLAPVIDVGGISVPIPDNAFLQAVPAAAAQMAILVVKAVGRAKSVADLFAGLGTLTLPLAVRARVAAYDSDADALNALEHATRHASGLKPVDIRRRDLFREPLARGELNQFDAVVFDPPRAGAAAQAEALARSKVPVVIAVSCNPATLARDVRSLIDGGYKLQALDLIDQFLFSPHLEAVAVLRRGK